VAVVLIECHTIESHIDCNSPGTNWQQSPLGNWQTRYESVK